MKKPTKKGDIMIFVLEIVGSLIIVGLIVMLFSGFAGPFLEFLTDYNSMRAFNSFTGTVSGGCRNGADTNYYVTFSSPSVVTAYAYGLLSRGDFTEKIHALPTCSQFGTALCAKSGSYEKMDSCMASGQFCWCLLKIKYNDTSTWQGGHHHNCINYNYQILTVPNVNPLYPENGSVKDVTGYYGPVETFSDEIANELTSYRVEKIAVLECKSLGALGCTYTDPKTNANATFVFQSAYGGDIMVWMQPVQHTGTNIIDWDAYDRSVFFDSFSVQRPIAFYGPDYYTIMYSHPTLSVGAYTITNSVSTTECQYD